MKKLTNQEAWIRGFLTGIAVFGAGVVLSAVGMHVLVFIMSGDLNYFLHP